MRKKFKKTLYNPGRMGHFIKVKACESVSDKKSEKKLKKTLTSALQFEKVRTHTDNKA
jgi:hypothetical protein